MTRQVLVALIPESIIVLESKKNTFFQAQFLFSELPNFLKVNSPLICNRQLSI